MTKPNVLFLMTDQQRADAMSCASDGSWVKTPNLDRIAAEGVRFSNCSTTTPICIPARVTLATGLYPHNTHVWTNLQYTLPESSQTWMRVLRDMGYRTSIFGKTHLHPHRGDLRDREYLLHAWGLDDVDEIGGPRASAAVMSHMTARWEERGLLEAYRADFAERFANKPHVARASVLPLEEYADVYVGQKAKHYLSSYDHDQPWFCWVTFGGPHEPWDAPEPYASMYDPASMLEPQPRPTEADTNKRPQGWLDTFMERRTPKFDEGDQAAMRANYAGNVTLIDDQIGEILETIEQRGELDNTIIAFTSDHGEMNGDWDLIYKMNFLDSSARVPLLFRSPKTINNGGKVLDTPVENIDLGPTVIELAGGELEYQQFGQSLVSSWESESPNERTGMSQFSGEFMITDGQFKMMLNREGEPYYLLSQNADEFETHNYVNGDVPRDTVSDLQEKLIERIARSQLKSPWY